MPASRTASVAPKPPGCATCRSTHLQPTALGSKSSWRQQIWLLGPNSSASPTTQTWHAVRSPRSATEYCMWPPASPTAPDNYTYASTPPGVGPKPSPPPGSGSATRSDKPTASCPDQTKDPTGPKEARPPERHRTTCHTHMPESPSPVGQNRL